MVEVGTKVQVFRGKADKTSGGLCKKDIVKVKVTLNKQEVCRYKSKKQQKQGKKNPPSKSQKARSKWSDALKKARKDMYEKYPKSEGKLVLVLNPKKKYAKLGISKEMRKFGNFLYKQAKKHYNE